MATTTKSQGVLNPTSTGRTKEEIFTLKNKIAELERQANEYKTKLDGLRRAKATTVLKLEKEYINTTITGLNRTEKSKSCEKCDEYQRMIENQRKSNTQVKKILEQKENNNSDSCTICQDFKQLLEIEKQNNIQLIKQIQNENKLTEQQRNEKQILQQNLEMFQSEFIKSKHLSETLRKENQEYQNTFQSMKKEHQDKIKDLSRREEEAKKQVDIWEQMYREWMATMERRVNNLQITNEELQVLLHNDNQQNQTNSHGNKLK